MITIVSGLPRSGTSLLMQMLHRGGMPILCDAEREPDTDNPQGYCEYDPVKNSKEDTSWVPHAEGKAVKVISYLLPYLPSTHEYKVLFSQRDMNEILTSQKKMLKNAGKELEKQPSEDIMRQHMEKHLRNIEQFLADNDAFDTLFINYRDTVQDPMPVAEDIVNFLDVSFHAEDMVEAVSPDLYRNRD